MHTSRTARLITWMSRLGLMTLLLGLLLSLSVGPASAAPPAPAVSVTSHGTWAKFAVTSPKPVAINVSVLRYGVEIISNNSGGYQYTSWQPDLNNLEPHTYYDYLVTTSDASGSSHKAGGFWTKTRKVTISIPQISVGDDSDALSAGDLTFFLNTNNAWSNQQFYGQAQVKSGTSIFPKTTRTLLNGANALTLAIQAVDDDCPCSGNDNGEARDDYGETSHAGYERGTAYSAYYTFPKNSIENYTTSVWLSTPYYAAVRFDALVTISVTYV